MRAYENVALYCVLPDAEVSTTQLHTHSLTTSFTHTLNHLTVAQEAHEDPQRAHEEHQGRAHQEGPQARALHAPTQPRLLQDHFPALR
jgi:hypothetical protein